MTLPFDDKPSRKFQCFVCAVQFTDFNEFVDHIKETHEEGREYVLCPLARCGCPVRDVRSHMRAKHQNEKIPQIGQMKAIIWKDISPTGKVKNKRPKFKEGYYESTKMGKTFKYRSGWESVVYECLDSWHQVIAYEAEPFKIPYIHEGKCHEYIPDIFVAFLDGTKAIWEIKPAAQTSLEKNQDKWFSAKRACEARGWDFAVITEQEIEKLKKKVKNQHLMNEDMEE